MQIKRLEQVFIIVTIPTHLRVLMEVANLLRDSGQYAPVMVYYPSAVFDQNHANCQQAPHEAFIWTGSRFLSKADYMTGAWRSDPPARWLPNKGLYRKSDSPARWLPNKGLYRKSDSPARWLPNKGLYRKLERALPFLPNPTGKVISEVVSVLRFVAGAYGIVHSALFSYINAFKSYINAFKSYINPFKSYINAFKSPTVQNDSRSEYVNRSWLQRFLLHAFSTEWDSSNRHELQSEIGFRQRLTRLFSDGLFSGLSDQKIFHEKISELIQSQRPVLIVLPEANLFYNSQFVTLAARLNTIPVVIVPFTIVNTLEWAEAFFDVPLYQANKGWNRLFARAFPHWVLEHKGRSLLLPPTYILGCEYFDMVPAIPWLINSGDADAIAAESQFMSDYYIRAGIHKEKVRFTGALSDDRLFALIKERGLHRRALGERFGILIKEKVILIGLPPDQFGGGKRQGCEFDSYEDLIRFMVGVVASLSGSLATVLINLHPRIKHADVVWLSALGATIIDEPIERLVPLVDVYVAVASATIRLGISCGIPVVNYDAYQYDYDDYKGLAGVCEVKSRNDYETVVDGLIHDQQFYSKIHAAQKATASNLCLVDGKAGERLLNLFDCLTTSGEVA